MKTQDFEPIIYDFSKKFSDTFDKRYMGVLCFSVIIHSLVVVYFLFNPVPASQSSIKRIQEQLANTIKDLKAVTEEQYVQFEFQKQKGILPDAPQKKAAPKKSGKKVSPPPKSKTQVADAGKNKTGRRRSKGKLTQKKLAASVGNKGVLALLTSSSSKSSGSSVSDFISGSKYKTKDLDKTISGLSGLRGSGNGSNKNQIKEVKGTRSIGSAGIDDLVSDLGATESLSFERAGDFAIISGDGDGASRGGGRGKGRNADDIQAVVVKHNKSVQYCYERELRRNPDLKGKIVVRFTISPQGSVVKVEVVSSTVKNRQVERCVVNRIRRWNDFGEVAESVGNTVIRQTYAFGY